MRDREIFHKIRFFSFSGENFTIVFAFAHLCSLDQPHREIWLKLNREFMKQHRVGLAYQPFCDALDVRLDKHRAPSPALLYEVGLSDHRKELAAVSILLFDSLDKVHQRAQSGFSRDFWGGRQAGKG